MNAQWKAAQVAPFFQDNLRGRYPLVRSSIQWSGAGPGGAQGSAAPLNSIQWVDQGLGSGPSRSLAGPPDAPLAAFGRFFGPNGLMDRFFKQYLQPHIDTSQGSWRWRGPTGPEQSISPEALQAFQRAAAVRAALFGDGQNPTIRFQMTPLQLGPGVSQATISLDGQTFVYSANQAGRPGNLQWTGTAGQAHIELLSQSGGSPARLSETGPWAWFKLLDQAQIRPLGAGQFQVTFQLGGLQAIYQMQTPGSTSNPFSLQEMVGFQCPEQL